MNAVQWENRLAEFKSVASQKAPKSSAEEWAKLIESKRENVLGLKSAKVQQKQSVAKSEGVKVENRWAMQGYIKSKGELDFNTDFSKKADNQKRILGNYLDLVV